MAKPVAELQRFLQRAFARVGGDYTRRLRAWLESPSVVRRPSTADYVSVLADESAPLLASFWRIGAKRSLRGIIAQLGKHGLTAERKGLRYVCKDSNRQPRFEFGWDLFNRRIEQAANQAVFAFCESTMATLQVEVDEALGKLHTDLLAGLRTGETLKDFTAEVQSLFGDPAKALQIAHTEQQRAVHGGQFLAAKESGIVKGKRWLASSDACDQCLALAALGEIPLERPFWVNPKGGPYAVVMHPGLHPGCFCGMLEVVDYTLVEGPTSQPLPGLAYRARLRELEEVL